MPNQGHKFIMVEYVYMRKQQNKFEILHTSLKSNNTSDQKRKNNQFTQYLQLGHPLICTAVSLNQKSIIFKGLGQIPSYILLNSIRKNKGNGSGFMPREQEVKSYLMILCNLYFNWYYDNLSSYIIFSYLVFSCMITHLSYHFDLFSLAP